MLNNRTTDVKADHRRPLVTTEDNGGVGPDGECGSKKEGGHDQKVTVANDQHLTIK
ncbi:MAG: hypothetical protein ACLRP3_00830 [Escherichia sp.]